jgi:hypothetical protein
MSFLASIGLGWTLIIFKQLFYDPGLDDNRYFPVQFLNRQGRSSSMWNFQAKNCF